MNNFNLSGNNLNALLNLAGKKLGQDPNALREQLESGQLDGILSGLDPNARAQVNAMLRNPQNLETLMGDQKVKNMLSGILGGKK